MSAPAHLHFYMLDNIVLTDALFIIFFLCAKKETSKNDFNNYHRSDLWISTVLSLVKHPRPRNDIKYDICLLFLCGFIYMDKNLFLYTIYNKDFNKNPFPNKIKRIQNFFLHVLFFELLTHKIFLNKTFQKYNK